MADFILFLGTVGFQDFEVPEEIKAGGAQALQIHKYAGGVRTIDTMGPDDAPLTWSGWFEGPNAQARCQQLDIMRRQGQAIYLAWSAYAYLVVIHNFQWDFKRYYHIRYQITLEVVQDLDYPPSAAGTDPDQQMNNDLSDTTTDGAGIAALAGAP